MSFSTKDLLDLLDRVLPKPFKYGIFLFLLWGSIWALMRWKLISEAAVLGQIGDIAGLVLAVGTALIALGLLLSIVSLVAKAWKGIRRYSERKARANLLWENLNFLPIESRALLLSALHCPSGRFPSPGEVTMMSTLYNLHLVKRESSGLTFTPYTSGAMMRVVPEIYSRRDEIIEHFTKELSGVTGLDCKDEKVVAEYIEAKLQRGAFH